MGEDENSFFLYGETLNSQEKLDRALKEIEAIRKTHPRWSFEKAFENYVKQNLDVLEDRSNKLKASDITPLWLYLLKTHIPQKYKSALKKLVAARYQFECPKCSLKLNQFRYDQLQEDEAYKQLEDREWRICPNCHQTVVFNKRITRTKAWEREKLIRKFERLREKDSIPISNTQAHNFLKGLKDRDEKFVPEYEKLTRNRRMAPTELEELRRRERPYLEKIYESIGRRLCAFEECYKLIPLESRTSRLYCSEICRSRTRQRRYRKSNKTKQ